MPCRYVIDKERRVVLSTAWDLVTFAELKTHQNQLKNDPDFSPEFNQLLDMRDVATLGWTVRLFLNQICKPDRLTAFVISDPLA